MGLLSRELSTSSRAQEGPCVRSLRENDGVGEVRGSQVEPFRLEPGENMPKGGQCEINERFWAPFGLFKTEKSECHNFLYTKLTYKNNFAVSTLSFSDRSLLHLERSPSCVYSNINTLLIYTDTHSQTYSQTYTVIHLVKPNIFCNTHMAPSTHHRNLPI